MGWHDKILMGFYMINENKKLDIRRNGLCHTQ